MSLRVSKYRTAVALQYDEGEGEPPVVTVKGNTYFADEIVQLAERFGVPVIEYSSLAQALTQVTLDQPIPDELFRTVAIVLNEVEKAKHSL